MSGDGFGIYGVVSHLAGVGLLVLGALLFFLYFLYRGRLDFDEGPAQQMMNGDDHGQI